ncbi:unnamed protein product, partial [Closterium sp. Naga37s-1]
MASPTTDGKKESSYHHHHHASYNAIRGNLERALRGSIERMRGARGSIERNATAVGGNLERAIRIARGNRQLPAYLLFLVALISLSVLVSQSSDWTPSAVFDNADSITVSFPAKTDSSHPSGATAEAAGTNTNGAAEKTLVWETSWLGVTKEQYLISGAKYLYVPTAGDLCMGMGHFKWSLVCRLSEAAFLNRTLVLDTMVCLNGAHNNEGYGLVRPLYAYFDLHELKRYHLPGFRMVWVGHGWVRSGAEGYGLVRPLYAYFDLHEPKSPPPFPPPCRATSPSRHYIRVTFENSQKSHGFREAAPSAHLSTLIAPKLPTPCPGPILSPPPSPIYLPFASSSTGRGAEGDRRDGFRAAAPSAHLPTLIAPKLEPAAALAEGERRDVQLTNHSPMPSPSLPAAALVSGQQPHLLISPLSSLPSSVSPVSLVPLISPRPFPSHLPFTPLQGFRAAAPSAHLSTLITPKLEPAAALAEGERRDLQLIIRNPTPFVKLSSPPFRSSPFPISPPSAPLPLPQPSPLHPSTGLQGSSP